MQEIDQCLPMGKNLEEVNMNKEFQILTHKTLASKTLVTYNHPASIKAISLNDTAISIMTDFYHVRPFLIPSTATLDEINLKMIACSVRLLFVADNNEELLGLVTYNDLYGEKPVRYIQQHGGQRDEITAQDIMTPLNQLEALQRSDISKACVGDILKTLKNSGRQHLLVVEEQGHSEQAITGLFSSTQMEKRLGIKIDISPRANTFADLERALA